MAEDERVDLLSFTGSTPVGFHNNIIKEYIIMIIILLLYITNFWDIILFLVIMINN